MGTRDKLDFSKLKSKDKHKDKDKRKERGRFIKEKRKK